MEGRSVGRQRGVPWTSALFHRDGNRFRIHRARYRNLFARLPTMRDVEAHRHKDAFLGLFDCLSQPIYAGEILAVGVVLAAFAFDSNGVCIERHNISMLQDWRQPTQAKRPVTIARNGPFEFNPGSDLRSHTVTRAVSSAQRGLTSVFGMGTGVTPAIWPPGKSKKQEAIESRELRVSRKQNSQLPRFQALDN